MEIATIYNTENASFKEPLTALAVSRLRILTPNEPCVTLLTRAMGIPVPEYWIMSPKTIESERTVELVTVKEVLALVASVPVVRVKMNPAGELIVTPEVKLVPCETELRVRRTLLRVVVLRTLRLPRVNRWLWDIVL